MAAPPEMGLKTADARTCCQAWRSPLVCGPGVMMSAPRSKSSPKHGWSSSRAAKASPRRCVAKMGAHVGRKILYCIDWGMVCDGRGGQECKTNDLRSLFSPGSRSEHALVRIRGHHGTLMTNIIWTSISLTFDFNRAGQVSWFTHSKHLTNIS